MTPTPSRSVASATNWPSGEAEMTMRRGCAPSGQPTTACITPRCHMHATAPRFEAQSAAIRSSPDSVQRVVRWTSRI